MIEAYLLHIIILIAIYLMIGFGMNLLVCYGGLLNLGYLSCFAVSVYTTAILSTAHFPLALSISASIIASICIASILAVASTQLDSDYFALASFSMTIALWTLAKSMRITGGTEGISGIPHLPIIKTAGIAIGCSVLCFIITQRLLDSRFCRRLQAVRDHELLAGVLGIDTTKTKAMAFIYASILAGIAGIIYAHHISFVNPSIFGIHELILILTIIFVGGPLSLKGTAIAGVLLITIPEILRWLPMPASLEGPLKNIIYAVLLIGIITWRPQGLYARRKVQTSC
ncbi:MAG: branched-chain amino acid ABC transporter permease [Nanoarchaeota archaeon]